MYGIDDFTFDLMEEVALDVLSNSVFTAISQSSQSVSQVRQSTFFRSQSKLESISTLFHRILRNNISNYNYRIESD